MNVQDKLARAQQAIAFITSHDDAPIEEVEAAVDQIQQFAGAELEQAKKRRAEKAAAQAKANDQAKSKS